MKDVRDMSVVIRIPIRFHESEERFRLRFEVMNTKYVSRKGWLPYATEREWLEYIDRNKKPKDTRVIE